VSHTCQEIDSTLKDKLLVCKESHQNLRMKDDIHTEMPLFRMEKVFFRMEKENFRTMLGEILRFYLVSVWKNGISVWKSSFAVWKSSISIRGWSLVWRENFFFRMENFFFRMEKENFRWMLDDIRRFYFISVWKI
jgi:hypothetical protein